MKRTLNLVLPLMIVLFPPIFVLCSITPIHALDISISWNANTEDDLAGYRIYYKTDSPGEPYDGIGAEEGNSPIDLPVELIDTNSPTFTLTNLSDTQVYYFVVTAYDTSNLESDYSNEVSTSIIDSTAPSVAITYSEPGPYCDADTILLTAEFTEAISGIPQIAIDYAGSGSDVLATNMSYTEDNSIWTYSMDVPSGNDGTAVITITGTDMAGNAVGSHTDLIFIVDNFAPKPPEVKKIIPHHEAGISDNFRVPNNTSFSILLEDFDGIDITDLDSIRFTINDGNNPSYERDLSDGNVVRVVKLDSEESDTQLTRLWVVYDRSKEVELGLFMYDQNINIRVDVKDIRQVRMNQQSYDFNIETREEHDNAQANQPDTEQVVADDPALTGTYNEGIQIVSGDHYGAKIVYDSAEPVKPIFGSENELPLLNMADDEAIGALTAIQPPTVFTTPVRIFIPCPDLINASDLSVYFYDGISWVLGCDPNGYVPPDAQTWMVADSRVNHNEYDPAVIEIKVYYSCGIQAGGAVMPPGKVTNLFSSPDRQTWSNDNTVEVSWAAALDEGGGSLAGYSIFWDMNTTTNPDSIKDIGVVTSIVSEPLADGNGYYFHIRAVNKTGSWGETEHWGPINIDTNTPSIRNYPLIDFNNKTIDITYSESDLQNVGIEGNYHFNPSLNFANIEGADNIINLNGNIYRLTMASIPIFMIYALTPKNIIDIAGNAVSPAVIIINDNDGDQMADDWEIAKGVSNPDQDPDNDGLTNIQEFTHGTEPRNFDTDNDNLPDGWEVENGIDPKSNSGDSGSEDDFDMDGWSNYEEYEHHFDPTDSSSPGPTPPKVKKINPYRPTKKTNLHYKDEIIDDIRIPINTSFCVLFEDSDGIDITDANSVKFTITDGVNLTYERDLSNTNVVRVVKLNLEESDTQITKLWVVYDRSKEGELGLFPYDQNVNIKIDAQDIRQNRMEQTCYDFEIESEEENDNARANMPETGEVAADDPALTGSYNEGIQVISGDLYGAKIIYNSIEAVIPTFGSINELPSLNISNEAVVMCMALQPPTVFSTPVKIFIPCPGRTDVSKLGVYLYDGIKYVMACSAGGQVQPGGEDWMVPASRVDHNEDDPATIEIKVYYFFGGVLAQEVLPKNLLPSSQIDNNVESGGAGGGCFINSL